ncbi:hypothetical protein [Flavobacterium sp.]|uniref:hypothetical protein n=1 Tax=Flavobacterium sp. TaxID=239 RepID=UPI00286B1C5F|nr:hypothetical protein [Flavobacterium sp.]
MKKYILTIILFSISQVWSQEWKAPGYQKKMFDEGKEYLSKLEYSSAAGIFQYVNELNPNNDLGKIAKTKSDSLKPIARIKLIVSIIGKWKLKETGSNWGFQNHKDSINDQLLIIEQNKFLFFEQNKITKELKLIKSENIRFSKSTHESIYSYEFVFSDNQIWWFGIDKNNNQLRQMNTGEETEKGRTEIVCGNSELRYIKLED